MSQLVLQLIKSCLQECKQRVKCNGVYSDWLPVRCGIPQGSLLGPLLFNISKNDINLVKNSSLRLYADDTTQYSVDTCPVALENSLNHDINILSVWFSENLLQMNGNKTQAMILGKSDHRYNFRIGSSIIEIEDTLKILGVTLDKNLNFKPYINQILRKAYAKIAALHRLKRMVPVDILVSLYKTYVLPHLEHCSPLLIGLNKTLKDKLEQANYYGLRTLMNLGKPQDMSQY